MAGKDPKDLAITGGLIAAGLIALVLLVALVKPLFRFGSAVGDTASNIGGIGADVTGAARKFTKRIKEGPDTVGKLTKHKPGVPSLHLTLVENRDNNSRFKKKNWATFRVTNPSGAPVAGALVRGLFRSRGTLVAGLGPLVATLKEPVGTTDLRGEVQVFWQVPDVPGSDAEDDVDFLALHPSYNPSNTVVVR